ncbi:hypothetical protein [Serratia microhaemolytica]|uniref:hypothetical protein n=1 Tax=Serratia microhaemolytica TaxID=2675110 RepID=UPI000FDECCEE|nr:hypothetical protein [Serratia microhaemolytica]
MSNLSLKAGSPLCDCDIPDPCVSEIRLKSGKVEKLYPIDPLPTLKVYDSGSGVEVEIEVTSKCHQPNCPDAQLNHSVDNRIQEKKLPAGQVHKETVYFKEEGEDLLKHFLADTPWKQFADFANPLDLFRDAKQYQITTTGCHSTDLRGKIEVNPSVEFYIETGLSYSFDAGERSVKERRDEQIKKNKQHPTLPKDRNKLRNGWTLHTDAFYITRQIQLDVSFKLDIYGKDYSKELASKVWRKHENRGTLDTLNKLDTLVSNTKKYLMPTPGKSSTVRAFPTTTWKIEATQLGLCYSYRDNDAQLGASHFIGFHASPLYQVSFRVDIIQLIAAYYKADAAISKIREVLARREEENSPFSAEVDCYLEISTNAHLKIGALYQQEKWAFHPDEESNKLELSVIGGVSLAIETNVMVADIALSASANAEAKIETTGRFELDKHDDGIDLVGTHDGIKALLQFKADFTVRLKSRNIPLASKNFDEKKEFIIADKLEKEHSAFRISLMGKARPLPAVKTEPLVMPLYDAPAYPYHPKYNPEGWYGD